MAMQITPEAKRKIQLFLLAVIALAAVRAGYILYQRHAESIEQKKKQAALPLNPDYYVSPKKLYPYDLKSARQLTRQPVWVKEGYRYTYYRYDASRKQVDFSHNAGLLLPIEKLEIEDVITAMPTGKGERKQVMAVFQEEGKSYAVPVGFEADEQYKIYSDEMFFVEDPHELYKHWPADVWRAVQQHEVKTGMNELQVDFAVGMGTLDSGSS